MKAKLQVFFRAFMVCLLLTLVWSVWASAQPATNQPASVLTNQPSALVQKVERLEEHYLTFGLDRIEPLRDISFFGQPLLKYAASLIYILLALYISKLIDYVTSFWLAKWAAKTKTNLDDLLAERVRGPVKLVTFVIFLNIGLNILACPR